MWNMIVIFSWFCFDEPFNPPKQVVMKMRSNSCHENELIYDPFETDVWIINGLKSFE
jgi:hypothetical protein